MDEACELEEDAFIILSFRNAFELRLSRIACISLCLPAPSPILEVGIYREVRDMVGLECASSGTSSNFQIVPSVFCIREGAVA